jgi:large subunit ribosomal protein L23
MSKSNTKTVYEVLRRPLVTEKGNVLRDEQNQYLFEVAMDATKQKVRDAVEKLFDVRVEEVRTAVVRGKLKRVGRHIGKRNNWKKAVVKVHEGDKIEIFEGV